MSELMRFMCRWMLVALAYGLLFALLMWVVALVVGESDWLTTLASLGGVAIGGLGPHRHIDWILRAMR